MTTSTTFSFGDVLLDCANPGDWTLRLARECAPDGAELLRIALDAPVPCAPPEFTVRFLVPQKGLSYQWRLNDGCRSMLPEWGSETFSQLTVNMPLYVYHDGEETSHLSLAASECARRVRFVGGIREEGSLLNVRFAFFTEPEAPLSHYETALRIDTRPAFFGDAIRAASRWILDEAGYEPCAVPAAALDPLYSSWYNFHQDVHAADLEAELAIAADLGMKTLIVDDGWQTDDTNRGYAFCGDWQVSRNRFPDMRAHVAKAHALGFRYMVWYSVPYMGLKSANHERFRGKFLIDEDRRMGTSVLDPRFPEVRQFLVDTYVRALREWDIDGFKLDFIDAFRFEGEDPAKRDNYAGRDIPNVQHAVDRLMEEVRAALTAIKPDILIEFRQRYNGPAIRKYGNMFRVGDCPGDLVRNRVAIADMRLALDGSAIHSDMLEWNFGETPERAALFVLNSIFGVVQYSIMLREAPQAHLDMIRHWIAFSQAHRDTLLHGRFSPRHPELQYPLLEAESEAKRILGVYDPGRCVDCGAMDRTVYVLNATEATSLVLDLRAAVQAEAFDTFGKSTGKTNVAAGLQRVACPAGGYVVLR